MNVLVRPRSPAVLGGPPEFGRPVGAGRPWFPCRAKVEAAFAGILDRQWYTNHGPLAQRLERRIEGLLGVRHAVCVTSGTIGLMMAAEAQGLSGAVLLPATARPAVAEALCWAGLEPVFVDADPVTLRVRAEHLLAAARDGVAGVVGSHPWGMPADGIEVERVAGRLGLAAWFDASDAFGVQAAPGLPLGRFGRCEVFSFGPGRMVTATEGGCVTTDDDALAARLRNIRSSYGAGPPVAVTRTANGRMSEAQAAVALLSIDDLPGNAARAAGLVAAYGEGLAGMEGIRLLRSREPRAAILVVEEAALGLCRDSLLDALRAENIVARPLLDEGLHRRHGAGAGTALPGVDRIAATTLRLPLGDRVSADDAFRIAGAIGRIVAAGPRLRGG